MSDVALPGYEDRARVDARDKVLGRAPFAADVMRPGLVHAVTVPAKIAKGRVTSIETEAAARVPGTLRVLTAADFAGVKASTYLQGSAAGQPGFQPMLDGRVLHRGQPVALVVAETLESATEAAALVRATYAAEPFASHIDSPLAEARPPRATEAVGDAAVALAAAPVRLEAAYRHPGNHHNPMELISTTAKVRDGELFVWEGSQSSGMIKFGIARALGLDPGLRVAIRASRRAANLGRYLSPAVAELVADTGLAALKRGRQQNVAVLFADVRGFTSLSEVLAPHKVADLLTRFRLIAVDAIEGAGGGVDEFVGDAVMGLFGLPAESREDAANAILAGHRLLAAVDGWSRSRLDLGLPLSASASGSTTASPSSGPWGRTGSSSPCSATRSMWRAGSRR